jgi:predicted deacylase
VQLTLPATSGAARRRRSRAVAVRSNSAVPLAGERPAVNAVRVLGATREGRRIVAYRVGDRSARRSAVVLSGHGTERDTRHIVTNLRDGAPVHGIDVWLVPNVQPRWLRRATTATNSRGVDLNRNFPRRWTRQPDSGRRPRERAGGANLHAVPRPVDPDLVVSLHEPLHGVDTATTRGRCSCAG